MELRFDARAGKRYEDTYGGWLAFLKLVAESEEPATVYDAPRCWLPFLAYLGAETHNHARVFPECSIIPSVREAIWNAQTGGHLRELVEAFSAFRPELADALWKSDMEWSTKHRQHAERKAFNVTNNGSFHRPEVLAFMERLRAARLELPLKRGCVIVPCAADKPYPAPLHKEVRKLARERDWRIFVATGVLGIVPEELWADMPEYDSGVPNRWRVMNETAAYFNDVHYERVIVYSDFYGEAVRLGINQAYEGCACRPIVLYPLALKPRGEGEYLDLLGYDNLLALEASIAAFR